MTCQVVWGGGGVGEDADSLCGLHGKNWRYFARHVEERVSRTDGAPGPTGNMVLPLCSHARGTCTVIPVHPADFIATSAENL